MAYCTENEKWAYIAGLIDGDGCITLCRHGTRVHYTYSISFSNTNKNICEWLAKELNANYNRISQKEDQSKNRKAQYQIVINSRYRVTKILKKILPYLQVKRRQAEIILDYHPLHNWKQGMRSPLLPKEEALYQEMKILNKVGVR